jgi:hypothetical protein
MPDITFSTYLTTNVPGAPLPLIRSVPVPPKPGAKRKSKGGAQLVPSYFRNYLIGWYGSTTLQQISNARRVALVENRTLYRIEIVVDGANYAPSRQHLNELDGLGVMHLDELPKETEKFVLEHLSVRGTQTSGRHIVSDLIWQRPARLGQLLGLPQLGGLNAVIFSAAVSGDARVYYAAAHPTRVKEIRPPANFPDGIELKIDV